MYFSEEIYNAMNYGYKVKVIDGYLFDKEYIFTDYVNDLYKMKENSQKGTPNYAISKLLLNSLYGKFGMSPYLPTHKIIDNNEVDKYANQYRIESRKELFNNKELISFFLSSSR